ncbi:MAG TPA: DNA polymerase III subunit delta, partial [Actinomycetota bacterium]|nr:DNA polymerase III subunit delta [Actinomycetota bacterium]
KVLEGLTNTFVDEFGPQEEPSVVAQALRTPSMFSDLRVVLIRDVDTSVQEFQRALIDYALDPTPGSLLVMTASRSPAKLAAAVRKVGHVAEATRGRRPDLFAWVKEKAREKALLLTADAGGALVEAVGEERAALAQAIETLSIAHGGRRVGPDEVREMFSGHSDVKAFGFIDAVASRDVNTALESLHRLIRSGESAQGLFWMMVRHFRMLLLASGRSTSTIAKDLGLPDWRAEKLVRQARGFSKARLIESYQELSKADRKMKRSEEPEVLTIERAVVAIARD